MTLAQMFSPFLSLNTNYYLSIEPQYTPQPSILLPTASFIGGKQKAADGMVTEANTCTNSMQGQGLTGSWWVNSRLSQSLMVPEVHTAHTTSTTTLGWGGGWGVGGVVGSGLWQHCWQNTFADFCWSCVFTAVLFFGLLISITFEWLKMK